MLGKILFENGMKAHVMTTLHVSCPDLLGDAHIIVNCSRRATCPTSKLAITSPHPTFSTDIELTVADEAAWHKVF